MLPAKPILHHGHNIFRQVPRCGIVQPSEERWQMPYLDVQFLQIQNPSPRSEISFSGGRIGNLVTIHPDFPYPVTQSIAGTEAIGFASDLGMLKLPLLPCSSATKLTTAIDVSTTKIKKARFEEFVSLSFSIGDKLIEVNVVGFEYANTRAPSEIYLTCSKTIDFTSLRYHIKLLSA